MDKEDVIPQMASCVSNGGNMLAKTKKVSVHCTKIVAAGRYKQLTFISSTGELIPADPADPTLSDKCHLCGSTIGELILMVLESIAPPTIQIQGNNRNIQ